MESSGDVLEEVERARSDLIASKTVPAAEKVRGEVAAASKRRPKDRDGASIVVLQLLDGTARTRYRSVRRGAAAATGRHKPSEAAGSEWVQASPPASFSSVSSSLLVAHGSRQY